MRKFSVTLSFVFAAALIVGLALPLAMAPTAEAGVCGPLPPGDPGFYFSCDTGPLCPLPTRPYYSYSCTGWNASLGEYCDCAVAYCHPGFGC